MNTEVSDFFDPLKTRLRNKRFKSISREYLAQLKKSKVFKDDVELYCKKHMVFELLEKYPEKLMAKFKENPDFLTEMDKNKSKFDWIKFELIAAIYHFLFVFDTSDEDLNDLT